MFQQFVQKAFISFFVVSAIFGLTATTNAQAWQRANGLVSWYRTEGNAADTQGTNNGILENGTTFAPGKAGQGFESGGTDGAAQIDAGSRVYRSRGFAGRADNARLTATFRDSSNNTLSSAMIGPVTPAGLGGVTGLLSRTTSGLNSRRQENNRNRSAADAF